MSQGIRSMPILQVKDVMKSAEFFTTGLNFDLAGHWDNDDGTANFAIIVSGTITLGLAQNSDASGTGTNWAAYCYVDDIDGFVQSAQANGVSVTRAIEDKPYGCRDCDISDLDGNLLAFGQDMHPTDAGPGL